MKPKLIKSLLSLFVFAQLWGVTIKKIKEINIPIQPYKACVDDNFNFYVIRYNKEYQLYKINSKGEIVDTFISQHGYTIDRAMTLMDIHYREGKIYLYDIGIRRISVFDTTGKFLNSFLVSFKHLPPLNIFPFEKEIWCNSFDIEKEDEEREEGWFFHVYSNQGELIDSIIKIGYPLNLAIFRALPFFVKIPDSVIVFAYPLNKIIFLNFNNKQKEEITISDAILITGVWMVKDYCLIASFKISNTPLPQILERMWQNNKYMEEIMERVKELTNKDIIEEYPPIGYMLDVYNMKKKCFEVKNYPLTGEVMEYKDGFLCINFNKIAIFELK